MFFDNLPDNPPEKLLSNLLVTTIDVRGTKRPEDGFFVDVTTNDIYFVTIIPNKRYCFSDAVEDSAQKQIPKRRSSTPFFSKQEIGLSRKDFHEVLVLRMRSPDHTIATFHLGNAKIRRRFTFEEAYLCEDDIELYALREYAKTEHSITDVMSQELVSLANWKINHAAEDAMKANKIPYLTHYEGKISMYRGSCKINRPLRDVVSLINTFQLAHFLKTGEILFSREEISRFATLPNVHKTDSRSQKDSDTHT